MRKFYQVWSDEGMETSRTDKGTADQDVYLFRWLGKKAWIEEVER